jgi:hypothetical protein
MNKYGAIILLLCFINTLSQSLTPFVEEIMTRFQGGYKGEAFRLNFTDFYADILHISLLKPDYTLQETKPDQVTAKNLIIAIKADVDLYIDGIEKFYNRQEDVFFELKIDQVIFRRNPNNTITVDPFVCQNKDFKFIQRDFEGVYKFREFTETNAVKSLLENVIIFQFETIISRLPTSQLEIDLQSILAIINKKGCKYVNETIEAGTELTYYCTSKPTYSSSSCQIGNKVVVSSFSVSFDYQMTFMRSSSSYHNGTLTYSRVEFDENSNRFVFPKWESDYQPVYPFIQDTFLDDFELAKEEYYLGQGRGKNNNTILKFLS